ncbi:MAG: glutamate-1-semialdehyde 2,1-aminomutase, partial [Limisphaerales bacterium]
SPDSAGVPAAFTQHTVVVPFNDRAAIQAAFEANPDQIAGIILEPIPANAGLYFPEDDFLQFLREITAANGALLIFDEVMTGFRVALGGVQERYDVKPDLSCFGKIIGGGLPVGAFGGRAEIMDCLAPLGAVYQAGTLSGNPLAMAAGIAAIEGLKDGNGYKKLEALGQRLEDGVMQAAAHADIPLVFHRIGSMFCAFFTTESISNVADVMKGDADRFSKFFHGMLERGVYLAPSRFETGFISTAHTEEDIDKTVAAAAEVMKTL